MKQIIGFGSALLGTAAIVASQPAWAASNQVTAVRLNPSQGGVDVVLETQSGDRPPQVFNARRGNAWTAYIFNAQLRLPNNQGFRQDNPSPGIRSVTVTPLGGNGVQVTVTGQNAAPMGQVVRKDSQVVAFSLNTNGQAPAATPVPSQLRTAQAPAPAASPAPAPAASPAAPGSQAPQPLVPNPQITIDGVPATPSNQVPPLLPRAIAPPVGDIAVSQVDTTPSAIDLGTNERVPRLVLRDAPVREVLSLLARAAGLNVAYSEGPQSAQGGGAQGAGRDSGGPTVSLDIENESVQDVFNYVLRIACVPASGAGGAGGAGGGQCGTLEANRVGRTIFVGPRLPTEARNLIIRSLRLNQVPVTSALNFLVGLGAESAVSRERLVTTVNAVPVAQLAGGAAATAVTQTQTTTESRLETQRVEFQDISPLLRGVQALADERTNSVTLIGPPRKVDIAIAQLTQLDVRRRLVAVNVRVIDLNLNAINRFGASFSFGLGNTNFINQGGVAVFNFGRRTPATTGAGGALSDTNAGGGTIGTVVTPTGNAPFANFVRDFFGQLQAAVTSGNAKILTDPTLVVQEGQTATVNLTQEVITNFTQNTTSSGGTATTTLTVEKGRAGLILSVKIDRVDDNGFVALSVAPSVSQPESQVQVNIISAGSPSQNAITLLSERRLETGQIRLRDGQTLLVSGIIQDQDRTTVTKVPLLGDIPLLGALFRRTERQNQRREVIVMLTPNIIDDSDRSTWGYSYTPSPQMRQTLEQNSRPAGGTNP